MRPWILVALVLTGALGACGGDSGRAGAPQAITGVVVEVDSPSLGRVRSFSVRSEGRTYEIFPEPGARYDFPLTHLSEHRATADPVRVEIAERNGRLVATSISDA